MAVRLGDDRDAAATLSFSGYPTPQEAKDRAIRNAQASRRSEITHDVEQFKRTLKSFDTDLCTQKLLPDTDTTVRDIISYFDFRADPATPSGIAAEHQECRQISVFEESAAWPLFARIAKAKGWFSRPFVFRRSDCCVFTLDMMLSAVSIVYLLTTRVALALARLLVNLSMTAVAAGIPLLVSNLFPEAAVVCIFVAIVSGICAFYLMFVKDPARTGGLWDLLLTLPALAFICLMVSSWFAWLISLSSHTVPGLFGQASDDSFLDGVARWSNAFVILSVVEAVYILCLNPYAITWLTCGAFRDDNAWQANG